VGGPFLLLVGASVVDAELNLADIDRTAITLNGNPMLLEIPDR
jgi:hypothetical protein